MNWTTPSISQQRDKPQKCSWHHKLRPPRGARQRRERSADSQGCHMEMKQLIAMVTVAEAGSVTYAAQMLHIVQPAVTRQIKTLEDELGVVLFDRTRHGMVLTS